MPNDIQSVDQSLNEFRASLTAWMRKVEDRLGLRDGDQAPPTQKNGLPGLEVRDGVFYERGSVVPFRTWALCLVAWAIFGSTDEQLRMFLDLCVTLRVRVIRILHWYGYRCPILSYQEKHLQAIDRLLVMAAERGIYIWFTPFHRQSVSVATGPETPFGRIGVWETLSSHRGQAGEPGEIRDLAFWDNTLEEIVAANQMALLTRKNTISGHTWAEEIGLLTIANEIVASNSNGVDASNLPAFYAEQRQVGDNQRAGCYRRLFDWIATRYDSLPKSIKKDEFAQFQAEIGASFFGRRIEGARSCGYQGPVNCSAVYGAARTALLYELAAPGANWIDVHRYSTDVEESVGRTKVLRPDPLSPARDLVTEWSLSSLLAASHVYGLGLTVGEVSGADEGARSPGPNYYNAPRVVASAAVQHGAQIVTWYAAHSHEIGGPKADNEVYDAFRDPRFINEWEDAGKLFYENNMPTDLIVRTLSSSEIFGAGSGPDFYCPMLGTQDWARQAAALNDRTQISLSLLG